MEILDTILDVIDLRSFSNLWYWIGIAVIWSSTSHWVLGIPNDMIQRGRREGGQAMEDLEDLARINTNRLLFVVDHGLLAIVGLVAFWLTVLGVLAFYYDVEFAQAVFLIALPLTVILWLSVLSSRKIAAGENRGDALCRRLTIHRRMAQTVGMLAIFVTGMYGTYQNLSVSILN